MLVEINNKTKDRIDLELVERVALRFLEKFKIKKQVSVVFVDDEKIKDLNKQYRDKDEVTDILSFSEDAGNWIESDLDFLGELIISYSQIKKQAKVYSKNTEEELVFILVHGLLHLMGYNDNTEKDIIKMEELGTKFINSIS